ncbi:MAG: hypothetical protein IAG13_20740 [Deltaproteobacteria bacterium]|nr:hypothetical protein [Nannocystaceae bacterium]
MRAPQSPLSTRRMWLAAPPAFCLAASLVGVVGCKSNQHEDAKWMAPPKSYDPKGADLTFNTKNLDAFNTLSADERAAQLDAMKAAKGQFKGQGFYQRQEELTDKIDDRQYGKHDVWITVKDPVYLEITVEYHVFFDEPQLTGLASNTPVEFSGTFLDMIYEDQAKPRRMELKVKGDAINVMKD